MAVRKSAGGTSLLSSGRFVVNIRTMAIPITSKNPTQAQVGEATPAEANQTYRGPFAIMTLLFFMWGFMTVFNDILIPRFKEAFTLDFYHAMFVQLAFFGAYFVGSL